MPYANHRGDTPLLANAYLRGSAMTTEKCSLPFTTIVHQSFSQEQNSDKLMDFSVISKTMM